MIEIIYGDYKLLDNDLYISEKSHNFFNNFLSGKNITKNLVFDNEIIKLSKKEIEWLIEKTIRPFKVILKDKHIKFTKTELKPLATKNKRIKKLKIELTDSIPKAPSVWDFLPRIAYDTDRKKLYEDMKGYSMFPVVRQLMLFADRIENTEALNLLDKLTFKSDKLTNEILCFVFKPIKQNYIQWWSRKIENKNNSI
jgi:hypothetical protein